MIYRLLLIIILAQIIFAGEVLAVKRVPKDATQAQKDTTTKVNPPPNQPGTNRQPGSQAPQQKIPIGRPGNRPNQPDRGKAIDKDKFIDEDGDGINDKIKKPPEIIKKKRDINQDSSKQKKNSR